MRYGDLGRGEGIPMRYGDFGTNDLSALNSEEQGEPMSLRLERLLAMDAAIRAGGSSPKMSFKT